MIQKRNIYFLLGFCKTFFLGTAYSMDSVIPPQFNDFGQSRDHSCEYYRRQAPYIQSQWKSVESDWPSSSVKDRFSIQLGSAFFERSIALYQADWWEIYLNLAEQPEGIYWEPFVKHITILNVLKSKLLQVDQLPRVDEIIDRNPDDRDRLDILYFSLINNAITNSDSQWRNMEVLRLSLCSIFFTYYSFKSENSSDYWNSFEQLKHLKKIMPVTSPEDATFLIGQTHSEPSLIEVNL